MKFFNNSDVNFLGKRARMNLNEVKNLLASIDEEAAAKGKPPASSMTVNEAMACFHAGLSGLNFSVTTPTGKQRNVMRLKWSTLTKYHKQGPSKEETEESQQRARQEFVVPEDEDDEGALNDNWWYEHDDHVKVSIVNSTEWLRHPYVANSLVCSCCLNS